MPAEWQHVADLASVQRDRNSEIRIRLMEGPAGYAVEIRKYAISHQHDGMNAAGFSLMVFADRIPELMLALDKGHRAAAALREASR